MDWLSLKHFFKIIRLFSWGSMTGMSKLVFSVLLVFVPFVLFAENICKDTDPNDDLAKVGYVFLTVDASESSLFHDHCNNGYVKQASCGSNAFLIWEMEECPQDQECFQGACVNKGRRQVKRDPCMMGEGGQLYCGDSSPSQFANNFKN